MIHRINHSTPTESPKLESTITRSNSSCPRLHPRTRDGGGCPERRRRRRSRERLAGNSRRRRNRERGVRRRTREPGRLVISSGGVISWMQLPSRRPPPPPPPNSVEREGGTKMVVGREGGNAKGEGSVGRCAAIFHPWRDGYRESASSDNEAS